MISPVNILDKLMDIELIWVLKEETVLGDFLNFFTWMLGSNSAFFNLSLAAHCKWLCCNVVAVVSAGSPLLEQ